MDGRKVFSEAVRQMISMLERACGESGLTVTDLNWIIPHQANGRIIEAMQARLKPVAGRVINDVRNSGNTSSSTVPLVLGNLFANPEAKGKVGMCAFGGGFTFGAGVLELV
jgi:3-oxoacyl-[acyl-carrier-protein] synthase-3